MTTSPFEKDLLRELKGIRRALEAISESAREAAKPMKGISDAMEEAQREDAVAHEVQPEVVRAQVINMATVQPVSGHPYVTPYPSPYI